MDGFSPRSGSTPREDTPEAVDAFLAAIGAPLGELPISARGIVARALAGVAAPRQAIKAKCLECVGYDRADITNCAAAPGRRAACPLWPYRPFQRGAS